MPKQYPAEFRRRVLRVRGNKGARTAGIDGVSPRSIVLGVESLLTGLRDDLNARQFRLEEPVRPGWSRRAERRYCASVSLLMDVQAPSAGFDRVACRVVGAEYETASAAAMSAKAVGSRGCSPSTVRKPPDADRGELKKDRDGDDPVEDAVGDRHGGDAPARLTNASWASDS